MPYCEDRGLYVDIILSGSIRERNRKALQIYDWLGSRLERESWSVIKVIDSDYIYYNRYFLGDQQVALLLKLTWGGDA